MSYATSLYLTGAEIGLSLTGLVLLLVAAWGGTKSARLLTMVSVAALIGAAIFSIGLFDRATSEVAGRAFGDLYRADAFGSFAKILIYLASAAVLVVTPRFFAQSGSYRAEYPVLLLFNAVGMGMMVSATDLMTLYIGLEMSSLSSYVLASFLKQDGRSSEAGLKYFVLGALASGIILYGVSLVYGFTGSTNYEGIRAAFETNFSTGALFGVVFVLAGLAFKVSAVPFHMWTPDVYEGAPTPVTAFFASAPKVAAMGMLLRMAMDPFAGEVDSWRQIVIFSALASIVVGALGAIGQQNLKRLLAYSSINNVGFILIGLAAATQAGVAASLTYVAIYVAMTVGSFTALLMLRAPDGTNLETFADISGLSTKRPALAWSLLAVMFSLAGIPPLFGFWGKFVVFQAAVQANLVALAAIGIAASVIGAFYYLKFIKVMFFDEPTREIETTSPLSHWAVLAICVAIISPLGYLLTIPLGEWTAQAAASFVAAM
ncbi:NADH-quinone oxidoreductase subunit NuoN [Qipengyuania qiaonensis]|uniref:NADH-quinone oxidoreductase subunit N n=1 Tax=Qipengyuania qiaonensis TaxID=2867240 RepID=A0ABS7J1J3_9SPHN|nr:NADH-quinone oxidoreductase subunit NuoN [Qipengyuania qiaonensis]MBX7481193.1 NADH-quinone oxidoreductase subunit NuoN [Qipengyuania qiaonensis]